MIIDETKTSSNSVVPHKAVAEVSNKIGNQRRGWLLWITDGRAKPLMDRKVVEVSSLSLFLSLSLSLSFSDYLPIYQSDYLSVCLSIYLSVCLSICLSASVTTKLFCKNSPVFELDNIKNAASQRDFLNFCAWQRQKRSNSARLPHFFSWQHQKTKQFCDTSFQNGKLSAELMASYHCVLRFFQSTCLKYCACHEKVIPGHTKCCTCHAK